MHKARTQPTTRSVLGSTPDSQSKAQMTRKSSSLATTAPGLLCLPPTVGLQTSHFISLNFSFLTGGVGQAVFCSCHRDEGDTVPQGLLCSLKRVGDPPSLSPSSIPKRFCLFRGQLSLSSRKSSSATLERVIKHGHMCKNEHCNGIFNSKRMAGGVKNLGTF